VPDRLHPHWQLVVDTEVRRTRPTLNRPIHDVHASNDMAVDEEDNEEPGGALVESDSDGENLETSTSKEIYPEEILTYKRRAWRVQVPHVGNHNVDISEMDAVLSEDENAPEVEDFLVVEA
jgi:hypothetical protein